MFYGHRYASLLSLQIEMCKDAEMSLKVRILDNKEKIVNIVSYVTSNFVSAEKLLTEMQLSEIQYKAA